MKMQVLPGCLLVLIASLSIGNHGAVLADQVFTEDVVVQASTCIGIDCNNGEPFQFATLKLKENNLRLLFQDTSSSASFPGNDWQIVINDSSNGGQNYFAIQDFTSGNTPFTIMAQAPADSLVVSSTGNIGVGTSTPDSLLHLTNGNAPGIRLEQDGSGGFSSQTWDIIGNDEKFLVKDTTAGTTPLQIETGTGDITLTGQLQGSYKQGNVDIGDFVAGVASVTFPTAYASDSFGVQLTAEIISVTTNTAYSPMVKSKTSTGFEIVVLGDLTDLLEVHWSTYPI